VLVGRAQRDVAPPRLAAGLVQIGAVRGEQAHELGAAAAAHGVREVRALVGVGAGLQQQPHVLETLLVERVRQRVGVARARAVLEQQRQAGRVGSSVAW
jgi:hypothetical protein